MEAIRPQTPNGWVVLNPESGGHQVVDTKDEAMALKGRYPSMRVFPKWGDFEVDRKFLNFVCWMTD